MSGVELSKRNQNDCDIDRNEFRQSGRVLIYRWYGNGFFSEATNMLLAILYCRVRGLKFVLSSAGSPYFSPLRWNSYFLPFCEERDLSLLRLLDSRPFYPDDTLGRVVHRLRRFLLLHVVQPALYPDYVTTLQYWDDMASMTEQPAVDDSSDGRLRATQLQTSLRAIDHEIWRYTRETEQFIDEAIQGLSLPHQYASLHIRRGDKSSEQAATDEAVYIETLERTSSLRDVYVATDDFRCVERIRQLRPAWRVYTLCDPNMRGHLQAEFGRSSPETRRIAVLKLLCDTELLRHSETFVGTFYSALGEYQAITRTGPTYGVDFDRWPVPGMR